jgi:DNA repair protein RadC
MNSLFKNCFGHEVKIQLIRESKPLRKYQITKPYDAYELVREELETLDREAFMVLALNTKNTVLGLNIVSMGTISSSIVHPREVFKSAILLNASCIMLVHNHPSGEPEPSKDDISITERLVDAGKLLGIQVIDHIIVGHRFFSFMEKGLLRGRQKGV